MVRPAPSTDTSRVRYLLKSMGERDRERESGGGVVVVMGTSFLWFAGGDIANVFFLVKELVYLAVGDVLSV